MKTTTETVKTKEQIATEFFEHNLEMIKSHYDEYYVADCKKEEMAIIIDSIEKLCSIYVKRLNNVKNDDRYKDLCNIERIYKLDLLEQILKF